MRALAVLAILGVSCARPAATASRAEPPVDDAAVSTVVARLDLARYKATIKSLTEFGDRRQGTERNRRALAYIAETLRGYGCAPERLAYTWAPGPPRAPSRPGTVVGGGRARGVVTKTGVNVDPNLQPDARLREIDAEPTTPGLREEVYCTKVGRSRPDEMYILGAHMDGHGFGEAANDDGSGTALVMELARILSAPDVTTERSIRFALWNNEETGLDGAKAYVAQRAALQGREDPPGSGRYPEPRWLAMIQHDMMLFDHGMPRADGTMSPEQRPEADVNVEFQETAKTADASQRLAWRLARANERHASSYPVTVGNHMTNTDSTPFMDLTPAISVRENERGSQIGSGWDPHWHQPTDVYATFSDADFKLGLAAAETTLAAVAELAGVRLK